MNGTQAIEFHRLVLLRLLAGLFEAAGMTPDAAPPERLSKHIRLMIARVLLPAESATKRLILFLSRRITLPPKSERGSSAKSSKRGSTRKSGRAAPSFWLFDKRKFIPELSGSGRRVHRNHEVDDVLYECHLMAWLDRPPTLSPP